jgi:hypothetical protein
MSLTGRTDLNDHPRDVEASYRLRSFDAFAQYDCFWPFVMLALVNGSDCSQLTDPSEIMRLTAARRVQFVHMTSHR